MTMTVKEAAFYRAGREARFMRQPRDANPYGRYANPVFTRFGMLAGRTQIKR